MKRIGVIEKYQSIYENGTIYELAYDTPESKKLYFKGIDIRGNRGDIKEGSNPDKLKEEVKHELLEMMRLY